MPASTAPAAATPTAARPTRRPGPAAAAPAPGIWTSSVLRSNGAGVDPDRGGRPGGEQDALSGEAVGVIVEPDMELPWVGPSRGGIGDSAPGDERSRVMDLRPGSDSSSTSARRATTG